MLFEQKVKLSPETHQYFHIDTGIEYKSVSKIIELVKNKFDKGIAKYCAGKGKYAGMDEKQVLEAWETKSKNSAEWGTLLHELLEYYEKNKKCKKGYRKYLPLIKSVLSEYSDYKKIYQELVLHNDEYLVAGTSDKPMLKAISKTSSVDISDYKSNEQIEFFNKYGKYLKYPLDHLQDCSYVTYSLQESIYAYFIECLTGRKIGRLYIHHIPINDPMNHKIIPVAYLRDDAIKLLNHYKHLQSVDFIPEHKKNEYNLEYTVKEIIREASF